MDAQATFSCSFTQTDLGPVAELPSLPYWPAQRLLPGPNPTLILVANSSESSKSKVSPFADAPILPRFRPSLDFHGRVFRQSIGPGSIGNPLFQRVCLSPALAPSMTDVSESPVLSRGQSRDFRLGIPS